MSGRRRNTFPIDKKTRDLVKRENILCKKVASSSDLAIRQEYNRVRNNVKGSVSKMGKKLKRAYPRMPRKIQKPSGAT